MAVFLASPPGGEAQLGGIFLVQGSRVLGTRPAAPDDGAASTGMTAAWPVAAGSVLEQNAELLIDNLVNIRNTQKLDMI